MKLAPIICALSWSSQAQAQQDLGRVYSSGAWSVYVDHGDEASEQSCRLTSRNLQNQSFFLNSTSQGGSGLFVVDPGWSMLERDVSFSIDVDGYVLNLSGRAADSLVFVPLNDSEYAVTIVDALIAGQAVRFLDEGANQFAYFALNGFSDALGVFIGCSQEIRSLGGDDPF